MAKKSFMDSGNPAMQFISSAGGESKGDGAPVKTAAAENAKPDVLGITPKSSEHKSKRAQLLMTPSLHEKVSKKAASLNMSFNELVNLVLEKYVQ